MTNETQRISESSTEPNAPAGTGRSGWRGGLRDRVVACGIRMVCGASPEIAGIEPAAAADIPLLSAMPRYLWLRILETFGVSSTIAKSAFGHRFVCHVGDYAEFPYYHRRALAPELALCAAWLRDANNPVIYDVGANVGFFATQLSQMLAARTPKIYAFEPVPDTFAKLVNSVHQLKVAPQRSTRCGGRASQHDCCLCHEPAGQFPPQSNRAETTK